MSFTNVFSDVPMCTENVALTSLCKYCVHNSYRIKPLGFYVKLSDFSLVKTGYIGL